MHHLLTIPNERTNCSILEVFQEIGCDLELRTGVKLDKCGVCGGNGTTCTDDRFV